MFVVTTQDAHEPMKVHGPFESHGEAQKWADVNGHMHDCWSVIWVEPTTKDETASLTLEDIANQVRTLRENILFEDEYHEATHDLPPFSTEHFLMGLSLLEQAHRQITLAHYTLMRGD